MDTWFDEGVAQWANCGRSNKGMSVRNCAFEVDCGAILRLIRVPPLAGLHHRVMVSRHQFDLVLQRLMRLNAPKARYG